MSTTFERIDMSQFPHGGMYDELRRCYAHIDRLTEKNAAWEDKARNWLATPEATKQLEGYRELADKLATAEAEIDRLRASALVWNTVTDDPKSHPEPIKLMLLDVGLRMLDYGYLDDAEFDPPMWNAFGGIYPIEIGHRWACIPETKKAEEVAND